MEKGLSKTALPASGSTRKYFRLTREDGSTVILVEGTDRDENAAFISLARHFRSRGINVPEVCGVSEDGMSYTQEDLGSESLWDAVSEGRKACSAPHASLAAYSPSEEALLIRTIEALPRIQFKGAEGLDFSVCFPESAFGAQTIDFDLNYFKYCFLKPSGVEFNEIRLQKDFEALKAVLLKEPSQGFMYRDFQTRNVMLRGGEPWFIDFQGGRKGPALYDVASFVWQARSRFPEDLKRRLVAAYADAARAYCPGIMDNINARLAPFVLFRCLQTLGAYGFRGLVQRKAHFLDSIPAALEQLREFIGANDFPYCPYLVSVLEALCAPAPSPGSDFPPEHLTVDVLSFSYRKGLPEDASGHGGGFIFDCRSIHNPGRYDRYKGFTGRDRPVIEFLEEGGESAVFLDNVFALLDAHTAKFLSRGFGHFQVAFGCTGGQHRSVYCAERTAAHLREKFGVNVRLTHRESSDWPVK